MTGAVMEEIEQWLRFTLFANSVRPWYYIQSATQSGSKLLPEIGSTH